MSNPGQAYSRHSTDVLQDAAEARWCHSRLRPQKHEDGQQPRSLNMSLANCLFQSAHPCHRAVQRCIMSVLLSPLCSPCLSCCVLSTFLVALLICLVLHTRTLLLCRVVNATVKVVVIGQHASNLCSRDDSQETDQLLLAVSASDHIV